MFNFIMHMFNFIMHMFNFIMHSVYRSPRSTSSWYLTAVCTSKKLAKVHCLLLVIVHILSNQGREEREALEMFGYEGGCEVNDDLSKWEKW